MRGAQCSKFRLGALTWLSDSYLTCRPHPRGISQGPLSSAHLSASQVRLTHNHVTSEMLASGELKGSPHRLNTRLDASHARFHLSQAIQVVCGHLFKGHHEHSEVLQKGLQCQVIACNANYQQWQRQLTVTLASLITAAAAYLAGSGSLHHGRNCHFNRPGELFEMLAHLQQGPHAQTPALLAGCTRALIEKQLHQGLVV